MENQGRLPEQAQSNASAMQIAQMHVLSLSQSLNRAQQERTMLETQLSTLRDKQNFAEANAERIVPGASQQLVRKLAVPQPGQGAFGAEFSTGRFA